MNLWAEPLRIKLSSLLFYAMTTTYRNVPIESNSFTNSNWNPRQKSWHAYPLLQHVSGKFISSSPSPRFNAVYLDEFVIACFQHCQGEGASLFQ